jgi:hypothetical protein
MAPIPVVRSVVPGFDNDKYAVSHTPAEANIRVLLLSGGFQLTDGFAA